MMKKIVIGIGAAFALFLILGAFLGNSPDAKERAAKRRAIEFCMDEAVRMEKQVTPDVSRFMYSACERMRQDFIKKWNREP